MRIGAQTFFGVPNANLVKKFQRTFAGALFVHALMQRKDFADLSLDRMQWIERGHRFLKDHRDVITTHPSQVAFVGIEQVLALKLDLARRMTRRGIRQQFQDGQRCDALAGTGLTDQRNRLPLVDME